MSGKRMILLTVLLAMGCQEVEPGAEAMDEVPDDWAAGATAERAQEATAAPAVRQPQYDERGALIRPTAVDTWVFLGTGVNLNYVEGGRAPNGPDLLSTTYMEPSAYRHYKQTGVFPEGTMTALVGYLAGSGVEPAKSGQFLGQSVLFEMSVKDSTRNPKDVWSYWGFPRGGQRGQLHATATCHACHADHAQTDFVFTQFYPNLRKPATAGAR